MLSTTPYSIRYSTLMDLTYPQSILFHDICLHKSTFMMCFKIGTRPVLSIYRNRQCYVTMHIDIFRAEYNRLIVRFHLDSCNI